MQINIIWDASAANAPAGFAKAVQTACSILDKLIGDTITISIDFGWGTAGPASNPTLLDIRNGGTTIGISSPSYSYIGSATAANTQTVFSQLASRYALTGMDSLISTATLQGHAGFQGSGWLAITYPQSLVFGLGNILGAPSNNGVGYVALNPNTAWNFDVNATPNPQAYDAISLLLHEITHDLGRSSGWTSSNLPVITLLDLFRYSAVGAPQVAPGGGNFSINGATLTLPFDGTGFDAADWAASVNGDPFGNAPAGKVGTSLSKVDLIELASLGYFVATAGPTALVATPNPGSSNATSGAVITLQFDETITRGSGALQFVNASDGSVYETIQATDTAHVSLHGAFMDITPLVPLAPGHSYYVTMKQGFTTDSLGVPFIGTSSSTWYAFSTNPAPQEVGRWFSSVLRESASGPHAGVAAQIASDIVSGKDTMPTALAAMLSAAAATSSVATLCYQFFSGQAPSAGGMDFLVSPTGPNPTNLNSAYYAVFNTTNRYINFAVNLGAAAVSASAASFAANYASLDLFHATQKAYGTIFGITPSDTKVHALLDPVVATVNGHDLTRADYFATYGGDGLSGIGTKAAMVGYLLAAAVAFDVGTYALSNDAFLTDVALHNAPFAVDVVGHYSQPGFAFNGG